MLHYQSVHNWTACITQPACERQLWHRCLLPTSDLCNDNISVERENKTSADHRPYFLREITVPRLILPGQHVPLKRQFVCWEAKQSKYPKALNVRTTMFTGISLRGFLLPTHATNLKLQTAFKEPPHYCGIYMLVFWGTVYCKSGKQERVSVS